ncbi:TIGR02269 family lipoprotein [Myxococcus sp. RHST-1-4]|nr:TIGR02269 family lipoprotein [Myxococcus sp. RHSTA-1-4]
MFVRWVALVGLLCACAASTPVGESGEAYSPSTEWAHADAEGECEDAGLDHCLAPACTGEQCALYRCEDFVPERGQVVLTRGSLPVRPPSNSQRYWGTPGFSSATRSRCSSSSGIGRRNCPVSSRRGASWRPGDSARRSGTTSSPER